jgi:hypothetical protein
MVSPPSKNQLKLYVSLGSYNANASSLGCGYSINASASSCGNA